MLSAAVGASTESGARESASDVRPISAARLNENPHQKRFRHRRRLLKKQSGRSFSSSVDLLITRKAMVEQNVLNTETAIPVYLRTTSA